GDTTLAPLTCPIVTCPPVEKCDETTPAPPTCPIVTHPPVEKYESIDDCIIGKGGLYSGTWNIAQDGNLCQRWDTQQPHAHSYGPSSNYVEVQNSENYCRNPGEEMPKPWCYTMNENVRWQYCDIPTCRECVSDDVKGGRYSGGQAVTSDGITCQRWDAQEPHGHGWTPSVFPVEHHQVYFENYCRNPDGEPEGPWCYTVDSNVRWSYCGIALCDVKEVDGWTYISNIGATSNSGDDPGNVFSEGGWSHNAGGVPQTLWFKFSEALTIKKYSFSLKNSDNVPTNYIFFGSNSDDCSVESGWTALVEKPSDIGDKVEYVNNYIAFTCYGYKIINSKAGHNMGKLKLYIIA
ncbi:unnamed protein product, partial [Meganyctiphanes norvegica]